MNILFLFQRFSFESSTIYLDLVTECVRAGHKVFVLAGTSEEVDASHVIIEQGCHTAYVKLPDQFSAGKIKKGLVQLMIEPLFINTLKKHLWNEKIDLIAYPTPPITLANVVKKAKAHYGCRTYLMLKDIFPQNAVDLGMMRESGLLHTYFKGVEKKLYDASDIIGCMSPANKKYMEEHYPYTKSKLCVFYNTVRIKELKAAAESNDDVVRFIVGGNLGKPQAIDFLIAGIKTLWEEKYTKAYFTFIGDGTQAGEVKRAIEADGLGNAEYHKVLPRDEYEKQLASQDVGVISLSSDFTIPNFPSRLLSYMQLAKPVFVVTDMVTDIGRIVTDEAECGFFTESSDVAGFVATVKKICEQKSELAAKGMNGRRYLQAHYDVAGSVKLLEKAVE